MKAQPPYFLDSPCATWGNVWLTLTVLKGAFGDMSFHFNIHTVTQAVALLLCQAEGRKMNYIKLIKLLYIADRESLRETNAPITGDKYVAMNHGPVLSRTYDLIMDRGSDEDGTVWSRFITIEKTNLAVVRDPGFENLSPYEIKKLKSVFTEHGTKSPSELCDLTHEFQEWKRNDPGDSSKQISLAHILEAVGRKDDIDDVLQQEEEAEYFAELFGESRRL